MSEAKKDECTTREFAYDILDRGWMAFGDEGEILLIKSSKNPTIYDRVKVTFMYIDYLLVTGTLNDVQMPFDDSTLRYIMDDEPIPVQFIVERSGSNIDCRYIESSDKEYDDTKPVFYVFKINME